MTNIFALLETYEHKYVREIVSDGRRFELATYDARPGWTLRIAEYHGLVEFVDATTGRETHVRIDSITSFAQATDRELEAETERFARRALQLWYSGALDIYREWLDLDEDTCVTHYTRRSDDSTPGRIGIENGATEHNRVVLGQALGREVTARETKMFCLVARIHLDASDFAEAEFDFGLFVDEELASRNRVPFTAEG